MVNLKVENLACERNDHMLFSGLNFDLDRGELVRIDGSNGSGKSTLLRTVCGLLLTSLDRETRLIVRDLLAGHMDNGGMALVTSHQELD